MKNKPAIILICAGCILMGIGIFLGQPASVMAKAIRVCMECVGIG